MNKWSDYFHVVAIDNPNWSDFDGGSSNGMRFFILYELRTVGDNTLIGTYNDRRYAEKQARFRFKKLQAKLEKILLT